MSLWGRLGVLMLGLGFCGCETPAESGVGGPEEGLPVVALPGAGGGAEDEIDALDFSLGPDASLHVVWREVLRGPGEGQPRYRALYSRSGSGGETWSSPEVLESAATGAPRIFPGRRGFHVLAGRELVHLYREEDRPWREVGRITRDGSLAVEGTIPGFPYFGAAVDATIVGEQLAVAFLSRRGVQGPLGLEFVRGQAAALAPPVRLAEFQQAGPQQNAPRLLAVGETLHLLWSVGEEARKTVRTSTGSAEVYSTRARLFYHRSDDGGATWQSSVEVTAGLPESPQTIESVELLARETGLVALYSSRGFYLSRSDDGKSWTRPRRILPYRVRAGATSTGVWSLSAAGGAVAWIDERFQSSDRRWWKPLGGWPWSDSPEGINNDVFLLAPKELEKVLEGGTVEPTRLTTAGSVNLLVRLHAAGNRLYTFWTGRRAGAETPSKIFFRVSSPESSGRSR